MTGVSGVPSRRWQSEFRQWYAAALVSPAEFEKHRGLALS